MVNDFKFVLKKRLIKHCTTGSVRFDYLVYLSFYQDIDELLNLLKIIAIANMNMKEYYTQDLAKLYIENTASQ